MSSWKSSLKFIVDTFLGSRSHFDSRTFSRSSGNRAAVLNTTFGIGDDTIDDFLMSSPFKLNESSSFYKIASPKLLSSPFDRDLASQGSRCFSAATLPNARGLFAQKSDPLDMLDFEPKSVQETRESLVIFSHIFVRNGHLRYRQLYELLPNPMDSSIV